MKGFILILTLITSTILCSSNHSHAQLSDSLPEVVSVPIRTAFIPMGFDSNDKTQIVVEGYFPNTCYKVGPTEVKIDKNSKTITVNQYAYKYKGVCLMVIVKFDEIIDLGILSEGQYSIKDGSGGTILGGMPVKPATKVEADDHLYAPVSDAKIDLDNGEVTVEGTFQNSCLKIEALQVIRESHNVIVALPLVRMDEENCTEGTFPFRLSSELPNLTVGRYLLHVRSLNGQAINKVFEVED